MGESDFKNRLIAYLQRFRIQLTPLQLEQCTIHFDLLQRWAKVHNLTTVLDEKEAVERHYVDSIVGLTHVSPDDHVLDAGSGAGFPGIIAGVLWPQINISLVETSSKKVSFLKHAIQKMDLRSVKALQGRIEDQESSALVLSRAAFSIKNLDKVAQAVEKDGRLVLWLSEKDVSQVQVVLKSMGFREVSCAFYQLEEQGRRAILISKRST